MKKRMNLKWRRRGKNKDNKNNNNNNNNDTNQQEQEEQEQEITESNNQDQVIDCTTSSNDNDIENQNSNMSFNDEEYAKALTNEQIEDCKEAFAVFVNHEGFVDISNLGAILRALGEKISDDEVQKITDKYDHDHFERGGKLNYEQFIELIVPRIIDKSDTYNQVNIDKLFQEFDADGDGYITATELRQSLHRIGGSFASVAEELTDDDVEEIIMECDEDGDGRISYSEFTGMLPYLNQIVEQ